MHATATKTNANRESTQAEAKSATMSDTTALRQVPLWSQNALPIQAKLMVNIPGDKYEQEADRIADQVTQISVPKSQPHDNLEPQKKPFFSPASTTSIQREEEDEASNVLTEGASLTYEQLKDQPSFEAWKKHQTDALKLKLWDNQPTALKAGIVGFGLSSAGLLGTVFALDPRFRVNTIDTLQDTNVLLPLSLLPYAEYFPASSFKYNLPTAQFAPYTFETEFSFDAWFKLMQEKLNAPQISLSVGVDSTYSQSQGFSPFTGGNFKLKIGGGIVNLSAFYNQPLPPTPMLISDPTKGEPPMWLMRSLPDQLEANLPKGSGIFLTIDILRLPKLFAPPASETPPNIQRKENNGTDAGSATVAPLLVQHTLRSGQGAPLDRQTKQLMESRFDQDFSQVRIHTGQQAAKSAQAIHAKAYTSGTQIVFGRGEYQPHTSQGQKLLAHELVHVAQQTGFVQRKETTDKPVLATDLKSKLDEGDYNGAYIQLNDSLNWGDEKAKKAWLADNPEIRLLFLRNLPVSVIADTYSEDELLLMPTADAYAIIDCWYQAETEKQMLYARYSRLFDHFLNAISPYTGISIIETVKQLIATIAAKEKYTSDFNNAEFHTIHLLAPTVERKIKFYDKYASLDFFKTVKKKFDPFTGLSLKTMKQLTDTNAVDHDKALEMYGMLKKLPDEQRRAFLDTALFAGALESDKDAQKYYKKSYKEQYKALPHNWDFAFFPWNWGEAPFADRLTVDHAALMSGQLNYEDLARRKFGFDKGLQGGKGRSISDPTGKRISDAARLLEQLQANQNFNDPRRLAILLSIAVRGGLEKEVTEKVLVPKNAEQELTGPILTVIESYGFIASDGFKYHDDQNKAAKYDASRTWYIITETLFGGDSGKVLGEQRGTFDLRRLQNTSDQMGSLGGMRFGNTVYQGDDYYNSTWLDEAVKAHPGAATLIANLQETRGQDRRGKIFASIRNDMREANVFASSLPIEGLNFFSGGTLYRSGPGVLQGLAIHLSWTKDTSEPDNAIQLQLDISNMLLNQFELIAPTSTLTLGQLGVKGFRITLSQNNLAAAKGLFIGLLKNADFMLKALINLLPNVLKLLPYAVMTMTEEFKGTKEHKYKDALGEVLKNDFSALDASVTFTSLQVRNMYDTAAGFLDDISIEKLDKDNKPVRQGLRIQENMFWTTDALFNLKEKIRLINEEVRTAKATLVGTDHAQKMKALEIAKAKLLHTATEKGIKHESRDEEMNRLRVIMAELRELDGELNALFDNAVRENPLYDPMPFKVLEAERVRLNQDLDYIDNHYFEDKKLAKESSDPLERFEARRRMEAFEAKYKSVDVKMALRGINLHGGGYVRDLVNDTLKSVGFIDPQLEGIENINIAAIDASFTASGVGVARKGEEAGVGIRGLHLPLIKAPAIALKTNKVVIEAGKPLLENVYVSVRIDFAQNPLAKDPHEPYTYILNNLYVSKATLNGLTVKVGSADPLLDFPAQVPVEVWGMRLWDYDPKVGNLNLKMQDIKAQGAYADRNEEKNASSAVEFGIDSTVDGKPRAKEPPALDLRYNAQENSITSKVNIHSAWIPSLAIQSPTLSISSMKETKAIQLDNVQAEVKVIFGSEKSGDTPATPTVIDIASLHIDRLSAQGITLTMKEEEPQETDDKKKKSAGTIQVVTLPQADTVTIDNLDVKGLRITLDEDATRLSTIDENASIQLGESDLGGIHYKEKTARGSVLTSIAIHRGSFGALTLEALKRNGRQYTLKEFFKFFGRTRLAGAAIEGSYEAGKNKGTLGIIGKQNVPISIDYEEPEDDKPGYYKIRLPLKRISLPTLHIEKDEHVIDIPKAKNKATTSSLNDVDVKLRAYVEFNDKNALQYDVYLDSLDIADLNVYGLEYHNKAKGIDVVFDPLKPLHIPNVKAGGFRFSTWKAFDVFGKDGGWIKAAAEESDIISAHFDSISAALSDGSFLAEKDTAAGRSALDVDIASFGFKYDKAGNVMVSLGKISGGFPKMTISQTDAVTGAKTTTTVSSLNNKAVAAESVDVTIDADKNTVIDAQGLSAGELTLTTTETLGKETSTTAIKLGPEALGAQSAAVKLNANKSKEITIKDIRGGKINIDLISTGAKGKSENTITLPDPEAIKIEALQILIDTEGKKRITVVKPTIKNVILRHPSQTTAGDYTKLVCDLAVNGNVELGDGNFDTLTFADPYNAFIGMVEDNVPVEIKNLQLEVQDSSKSVPEKDAPAKPLTADQEKLIELEEARAAARSEMINTPAEFYHGDHAVENPEFWVAAEKYQAAVKAYDDHKAKMIGAAKAAAKASMTKKYLDAVSGTVTGSLRVFDSEIPINIETYKGEHYVEISTQVTDNLKSLIRSLIATTVDMPFWSSKEMKAIGEGLKRWWLRFFTAPTAKADVDNIAKGNAARVIELLLRDIDIWPGILETDKSLYGINLNLEGYWGLDLTSYDSIGIGLCELQYKHPTKDNFYSLYGMIEYLQYVSPTLTSASGKADKTRLEELAKNVYKSSSQVGDMGVGEAVNELVLFIRSNLAREAERLKNTVLRNIKGVNITADVSLRPQDVISTLLKESQAGSLTFDKGKDTIDNIHVQGDYVNSGVPQATGTIGGGATGTEDILIPGATYVSQDKGTKISYDALEISPLSLAYEQDVYQLKNSLAKLKGLKFGLRKK